MCYSPIYYEKCLLASEIPINKSRKMEHWWNDIDSEKPYWFGFLLAQTILPCWITNHFWIIFCIKFWLWTLLYELGSHLGLDFPFHNCDAKLVLSNVLEYSLKLLSNSLISVRNILATSSVIYIKCSFDNP